jgi:hypothetical protein
MNLGSPNLRYSTEVVRPLSSAHPGYKAFQKGKCKTFAHRNGTKELSKTFVVVTNAATVYDGEASGESLTLDVSTADVQRSLRFTSVPYQAGIAIVIASVLPDSECYSAGLLAGQRLLKLSDPVRPNETWALEDNASLLFVRDAVKMRRSPYISLTVSSQPLIFDIETSDEEEPTTIGEKIQNMQEAKSRSLDAVQKRKGKRRAYMEQASDRNDSFFFLGVALLFLLPATVILLWALSTGYIDKLSHGYGYYF